jgi:hypothetical protein
MTELALAGGLLTLLGVIVWALVSSTNDKARAQAELERHRDNIEALDRAIKAGRDAAAAGPDELLLDDGFRRD